MEMPVRSSHPEPPQLSKLDEIRQNIGSSLHQMSSLLNAVRAPLPTKTGDGSALPTEKKTGVTADVKTIVADTAKLGFNTLEKVAKMGVEMKRGHNIDDREYLMEYMVKAASQLPDDVVSKKLTNDFVTTLWNDLEHPPTSLMDDKYQYRQADGSHNSYLHPRLGAAHESYARTVKPNTVQPGNLPDAGVLFDTLMARKEPVLHPNRISSMLFYLASIIIHDLFRTNHEDCRISDTSSYLDLSPLYGSDMKEQLKMRTGQDGKIKPDCFSETRLLAFPPGVAAILIMFNRFHNYVVENLALINEGNKFNRPATDAPEDKHKKYDEDLFQTGRLVTCGLYVNIILVDYVRTILNLNRTDENWQLDPRVEIPDGTPLGTGNQVSAEFNLVYRWHAASSDKDDRWTQELFANMFDGRRPEEVSQKEFLMTLGHAQHATENKDPLEREYHGWKRNQHDNTFADTDLVETLVSSIEDCANAMGPHQVPVVMRAIEVLGITQARKWNLGTLNEFRQHFRLKPYKEFSDISSNEEVAETLRHLYDHPDNVELYPGLVVEDAKHAMLPGSGLCPSYTASRAVLSDAVALVRGDRFYTTNYHPKALTNWGYAEANFDTTIDNGCVLYKLFLRAFPNSFATNSVYVHYPLTIPEEMHTILTDLQKADKYNFDRPSAHAHPQMVFSYDAAMKILHDPETFKVTWGDAMEFLMGPRVKDFCLAGDNKINLESRKFMEDALYRGPLSRTIPKGNEKWLAEVRKYYEDITVKLLRQKSFKLGNKNQVDIIRDVGNLAHVHFSAEMFCIPLKTEENPYGIFTEQQLYLIFAAVFICIFFDVDPAHSFPLRQKAHAATQQMGNLMVLMVSAIKATGKLSNYLQTLLMPSTSPLKEYGLHMIHRLLESGKDIKDIVWGNMLGTAGGMVANQGQLFGQIMDYLFTDGQKYLPELRALAMEPDSPANDDKWIHWFLELSRLGGETGVMRYASKDVVLRDFNRNVHFKAGDTVMVNFKAACLDASAFPDPENVHLDRPIDSYIHLGHGVHQCLGLPMTRVALSTMLKVVCRIEGLEPAPVYPGPVSAVKKVKKSMGPGVKDEWTYHAYMTEDWDMYFPFPTSLKVTWPGALP